MGRAQFDVEPAWIEVQVKQEPLAEEVDLDEWEVVGGGGDELDDRNHDEGLQEVVGATVNLSLPNNTQITPQTDAEGKVLAATRRVAGGCDLTEVSAADTDVYEFVRINTL